MFRSCPFAVQVLCQICCWWEMDFDQILSLEDLFRWTETTGFKGAKKDFSFGRHLCFFWCIWKACNDKIFGRKEENLYFFTCKNRLNQFRAGLNWAT
ncbi:hypothetical protein OSB04_010943 [Centaurea solstitialis]|uniref:Uncharacterized protein n=1 Tax=Centaurea solstitialis TaxID=347529 RepID=A0AA38TA77_9ASTR|nr:hypothetical protein OSB04_010943 [Centaurea solstitialis]